MTELGDIYFKNKIRRPMCGLVYVAIFRMALIPLTFATTYSRNASKQITVFQMST